MLQASKGGNEFELYMKKSEEEAQLRRQKRLARQQQRNDELLRQKEETEKIAIEKKTNAPALPIERRSWQQIAADEAELRAQRTAQRKQEIAQLAAYPTEKTSASVQQWKVYLELIYL